MKTSYYIIVRSVKDATLYLVKGGKDPKWSLSSRDARHYTSPLTVKRALNSFPLMERKYSCAVPMTSVEEPLVSKSRKKSFLVKLDVLCGGFEKNAVHLILNAKDQSDAITRALASECNDSDTLIDLEMILDGGICDDACGEFSYCLSSVCEVPGADSKILAKYL